MFGTGPPLRVPQQITAAETVQAQQTGTDPQHSTAECTQSAETALQAEDLCVQWSEPAISSVSSTTMGSLMEVPGRVFNRTGLRVLIDTGASVSFVKQSLVQQFRLQQQAAPQVVVELADGSKQRTTGCYPVPIAINRWRGVVPMHGMELKTWDIILGMDWLAARQVIIDPARRVFTVEGHML